MITLVIPIIRGLTLATLCFTQYAMQREILRGNNRSVALSIGVLQGVMGSVLITTLSMVFPAFTTIPGFLLVNCSAFFLPIASGLAAGGYQQLKQSFLNSSIPILGQIMKKIDAILNRVPKGLSGFIERSLSKLHPWFGTLFLTAQIATFAAATTTMPPLGIAGISYLALFYARGKNWLPGFIARPMEKANYYINLISGLSLANTMLKIFACLTIVKELAIYYLFPRMARKYLGKDSEFLQAVIDVDVDKVTKHEPKLSRDLTLKNFKALLSVLPDLSRRTPRGARYAEVDKKFDLEFLLAEVQHVPTRFKNNAREVMNSIIKPMEMRITSLYDNFPTYPKHGVIARIKYYLQTAATNIHLGFFVGVSAYYYFPKSIGVAVISCFNKIEPAKTGLATTISHMKDTPKELPLIPNVNTTELKTLIANSGLEEESVQKLLKANCLSSPKFQSELERYNSTKYAELQDIQSKKRRLEQNITTLIQQQKNYGIFSVYSNISNAEQVQLGTIPTNKAEIQQLDTEIDKLNTLVIDAWRRKLNLSNTTTDAQVFTAYVQKRSTDIIDLITTDKVQLWDKSVESLAEIRNKGMHIFHHIHTLLLNNTVESKREAHDIIKQLAIDAGDFCTNALYAVISDVFDGYVLTKLVEQAAITPSEKLALFLQQERQKMVDACIYKFKDNEFIKTHFPSTDVIDRHDYSSIIHPLRVFNLKATQNSSSDLSNSSDFITQMKYNTAGLFAIRILMSADGGYSPTGILWRLRQHITSPIGEFNASVLCSDWAKTFTNREVTEYIYNLLSATYGETDDDKATEELGRTLLFTLMLYDMGVFKTTDPDLECKINQILQNPAQDVTYAIDTSKFELPEPEEQYAPGTQNVPPVIFTQAPQESTTTPRPVPQRNAAPASTKNRCVLM